jgi:mono/diheme cytochrome c family protein
MHDQARLEPYEASGFFADGAGSRVPPKGTVARGFLRQDRLFYTGQTAEGQLSAELPFPVTRQVLRRGQQRFDIFCSPCHDRLGTGRGMIVRRGFKQPPSLHEERVRRSPVGYYFDVMTNGFATMPSYAAQIPPEDRWAIAAYLRALQLSQGARLVELPAADRRAVESATETP